MDEALQLAINAASTVTGSFKHGAAVVYRKEVVAVGKNYPIDHPRLHSMHAEMDALKKVPKKLRRQPLNIVVVRLSSDGELRLSMPCPVCQKLLQKFKIPKIYYSS
jgi:tRNA(Arg) A34 adenosine deaminase TadA